MKRPHISTTDTNTASPKQCQLLSLKDNECSLWDKERLPEISGEAYCDQTLPQAFSYRKKNKKIGKHTKKKAPTYSQWEKYFKNWKITRCFLNWNHNSVILICPGFLFFFVLLYVHSARKVAFNQTAAGLTLSGNYSVSIYAWSDSWPDHFLGRKSKSFMSRGHKLWHM